MAVNKSNLVIHVDVYTENFKGPIGVGGTIKYGHEGIPFLTRINKDLTINDAHVYAILFALKMARSIGFESLTIISPRQTVINDINKRLKSCNDTPYCDKLRKALSSEPFVGKTTFLFEVSPETSVAYSLGKLAYTFDVTNLAL